MVNTVLESSWILPPRPEWKGEWPKIVFFGDSVTRLSMAQEHGAFAARFSDHLMEYFDIDVRGFSGYNTRMAVQVMPRVFPLSYLAKVEVFVIFFGHNDSWENTGLSVPPEEFEKNVRDIVSYLTLGGLDLSKIILITPMHYSEAEADIELKVAHWQPLRKSFEHAEKYVEVIKRISIDIGLVCLDFFNVTNENAPLSALLYDGMHFSPRGSKLFFTHLWPIVSKIIKRNFKKAFHELYHVTPCEVLPEVIPHLKKSSRWYAMAMLEEDKKRESEEKNNEEEGEQSKKL